MDKTVISRAAASAQIPVSVVIPCYRCEWTIDEAVASVMQQTALPTELILVEDCSGDEGRTLTRLQQIQAHNESSVAITVLPLPQNLGPGEARNAGWAIATQPLLAFLDADDSWHPEKLALQSGYMLAHADVDLCFHDTLIQERGERLASSLHPMEVQALHLSDMLLSNRVATRTVMLRTRIAPRFAPGLRYAEDYHLWLQILAGGHQAARIKLPLAASYKADFGAGGLTGHLTAMHAGVQQCFGMLYRDQLLSRTQFHLARTAETLKYWHRIVLLALRRSITSSVDQLDVRNKK